MNEIIIFTISCFLLSSCENKDNKSSLSQKSEKKVSYQVVKTDEEWKKSLTKEQYEILRNKGTERAFTGEYHNFKEHGIYVCAGCGQELFSYQHKFDSGTGWPSFWQPISEKSVNTEKDNSHNMRRVEVLCHRCGGHLGHVFEDGPQPSGLRYCINSASLKFKAEQP